MNPINPKRTSKFPTSSFPAEIQYASYVYAWMRETQCLYIGQTTIGQLRLNCHHVIDNIEPVKPTDHLNIWLCPRPNLILLESQLIQFCKPLHNTLIPSFPTEPLTSLPTISHIITPGAKCRHCSKPFIPTGGGAHRLYCSTNCKGAVNYPQSRQDAITASLNALNPRNASIVGQSSIVAPNPYALDPFNA